MKHNFKTLQTASRKRGITALLTSLRPLCRFGPFRKICVNLRTLRLRPQTPHLVLLANIAEGQHLASQGISYKSDVVITERFLLAKRGAASDSIDICGAANIPIGLITDEAGAINDYVNVAQFNS